MIHDIETRDSTIEDLSGSLKIAQELRNAHEREIGRLATKVMELEREIRLPCAHVKRCQELEAEVERLKVTADNMASMAAAAADELDRYRAAAEMATIACASVWTEDFKRAFGVERLRLVKTFADQLPGITEDTRIEDYLCALLFPDETDRPRAHTWQQERAAVVAWLLSLDKGWQAAWMAAHIERGEHWPEGGDK